MGAVAQIEEQKRQKTDLKKILMAADFSAASDRALGYAIGLARRFGAEISIVHAIPSEPREAVPMDPIPPALDRNRIEAESEMHRLEVELELKGLGHRVSVEHGAVWDVISSAIAKDDPDLLVLGTHGRGAVKRLALGSVAEEVIRLASCPVLTVGPKALPANTNKTSFQSILFATDFGTASVKAFPYATFLAKSCKAKLTLLHMLPPVDATSGGIMAYGLAAYAAEDLVAWQSRIREESRKKLRALVSSSAGLAIEPEYVVSTDFLPEGILESASTHGADLIVMGANSTRSLRLATHTPWAVVHHVLCEAKCPVLTVAG